MSSPIKSQIIARLLALCAPLKSEGRFRAIERASAPFLLAPIKPCLRLIIGDESVDRSGESLQGWTCEFPALFELIVADASDPYALADASVAYLQEAIESDPQLQGLCKAVIYDGELPYTSEITKPVGGTVVMYVVQYRRERANPNQQF